MCHIVIVACYQLKHTKVLWSLLCHLDSQIQERKKGIKEACEQKTESMKGEKERNEK
jgi:hypothetical protein